MFGAAGAYTFYGQMLGWSGPESRGEMLAEIRPRTAKGLPSG